MFEQFADLFHLFDRFQIFRSYLSGVFQYEITSIIIYLQYPYCCQNIFDLSKIGILFHEIDVLKMSQSRSDLVRIDMVKFRIDVLQESLKPFDTCLLLQAYEKFLHTQEFS